MQLSSPELSASLSMERWLSQVGPIVLRGKDCSYIGGNGRTQIETCHRISGVLLSALLQLSTLNGKSCAKMGFALTQITGGSILLSWCCRRKYPRIWQTKGWKKCSISKVSKDIDYRGIILAVDRHGEWIRTMCSLTVPLQCCPSPFIPV